MARCLDRSEVEQLAAGSLPLEAHSAAAAHLTDCEYCRQALAGLREDEALFEDIKAAYQAAGVAENGHSRESVLSASIATFPEGIEGYEILSELHRGGQGVVFKAVQKTTKRAVALKVLLRGASATERQRQRFEREIELVAGFQHPNIVTVFDSGVSHGRQFYAMEYVAGSPLDRYLRETNGTGPHEIQDKLRLFHKICAAVSFAHQRGVIHRDLKPGNIVVDAAGEPHVLDFGLAKLAADESAAALTAADEFLGTLAYASPEQTKGDPRLIDVRSDVYSLGVVLYEMLTGRFPYDVGGSLSEVLRQITETEPAPPSHFGRGIDNEIETIVLKALAKEPDRRYQSADQLGRDISHYLNDEPIDAKRDSTWYVVRKSLHRHRGLVATAVAFIAVILGALAVSLHMWGRAVQDRDLARKSQENEKEARLAETKQREEAELQAYIANLAAATAAVEAHDVVDARLRLERAPMRLRNWEWGYLHSRLDDSVRTLRGPTSYVDAVAFSPDGQRLVAASSDKTARVWDTASGAELAIYTAPAEIRALAYSPDGKQVALGCWDGSVRLWDVEQNKIVKTYRGPSPRIWAVAYDATGARLAAAFGNQEKSVVLIWGGSADEPAATIPTPPKLIGLSFHPDGKRLMGASAKGVEFWDAATGERIASPGDSWSAGASCFAVNRAGTLAATGVAGNSITVRDLVTGELRHELSGHTQVVTAVQFHPERNLLVSGSRDKTVRIWNLISGKQMAVLCGHTWTVASIAFNPNGTHLATGGWDNTVKLWAADGEGTPGPLAQGESQARVLRGHQKRVSSVAWHPDFRRFASGSHDGQVILWDLKEGEPLWESSHQGPVHVVAFHPQGDAIASASSDRTVQVRAVSDGALLNTLRGHTDFVQGLAYSPDGRLLASGSRDNTLRLWDPATGKCLTVMTGHVGGDHVHSVAFSPDGQWVASIGHFSLKIWNAATRMEAVSLRRSIFFEDFALAFHPDSRRVAAGSAVKTLTIWDHISGKALQELGGHSDEILTAAFSPDGRRLVSGAFDGSVRVWDADTGAALVKLPESSARVFSLAFSPDGSCLAVGREDGSVAFWQGASRGSATSAAEQR